MDAGDGARGHLEADVGATEGGLGLHVVARSDRGLGPLLGGTRPLPELFAKAGAQFEFSDKTLGPLIEAIRQEFTALPA